MKQHTTRFLKSVALCYMAFPAVYLLVAALLFDIPARACVRILLSPFYYVLSIIAIAVGYGLWEMRRWAWYLLIFCNVAIAYASAVLAADHGTTHHKWLAYLISVASIVGLTIRVRNEVRVPYFLPRIRWWENNPRYRLAAPVRIRRHKEDAPLEGEILDLSARGCFIKTRQEFASDETVLLSFSVFGLQFECEGVVVWRALSAVTHPAGVGVKFGAMARPQKRGLRAVEQRLRKIAVFYRASRYLMNPEEFSRRMSELNSVQLTGPDGKS